MARTKKKKEPRQYRHPIMRSLKGQNLCIDMKMLDDQRFETHEYWRPLNEQTLRWLGYIPAENYKTGDGHMLTKAYIKFDGFEVFPCVRPDADGKMREVQSLETAGTLYDYFTSRAEVEFMEGMRVKNPSKVNKNMLILLILVAVGIGIGGYLLTH